MRSRDLATVALAVLVAAWRLHASPVPPWRDWTIAACAYWVAVVAAPTPAVRAWLGVAVAGHLLVVYGSGQLGPTVAALARLLGW
jgi:hypothetical protein